MEVLMKSGRYAGELRDVRFDCAKQMLADGRATDPRDLRTVVDASREGVSPGIFTSGNVFGKNIRVAKKKANH